MVSADVVHPELEDLRGGDEIRLHPAEGAPSYRVRQLQRPGTLVLLGADPEEVRVTWQFVLRPMYGGRRTRMIARQGLAYPRSHCLWWPLLEPVNFVMERRMLRGFARRAEGRQA